MWKREMEWLVCVGDHIVELIPSWQNFPDGSKLEVIFIFSLNSLSSPESFFVSLKGKKEQKFQNHVKF